MDTIIIIAIIAFFVLVCVAITVFYLLYRRNSDPIHVTKSFINGDVSIGVTCNRPVDRLQIVDIYNKEKIEFVRKNLRAGEVISFTYCMDSKRSSKLKIYVKCGSSDYEFS